MDVWVIDGLPDYHRGDCPVLTGTDSEPIPHDQAVEDGFGECTVCKPEAAEAPVYPQPEPLAVTEPEPATAPEPVDDSPTPLLDVWVLDGFPDYHRGDCPVLTGTDSEPIPHDQAVEDGFSECRVCQPEAAETPEYPQPEPLVATAAQPEPERPSRSLRPSRNLGLRARA